MISAMPLVMLQMIAVDRFCSCPLRPRLAPVEAEERSSSIPWSAGLIPHQLIIAAQLHLTLFLLVSLSPRSLTLPPPSQVASCSISVGNQDLQCALLSLTAHLNASSRRLLPWLDRSCSLCMSACAALRADI